jgi:hypothetical protein
MGGINKWFLLLIVVTCTTFLVASVPAIVMDPIIVAFTQLRTNAAVATPLQVTLEAPDVSGTTGVTSGKKAK